MTENKLQSSVNLKGDTKSYHLKLKFNGKEFESDTKDIKSTIMSLKPFFLKTNIVFSCTNSEGEKCEKMIPVKRAKMFWKSNTYMDMFINQLIFKEHV